jgi:hypothetical protein
MSNNIHLLELSTYEAPTITESSRQDWVEYGDKNAYYKYLIDMYTNSTTNNAIINNITRLVYGRGLNATNAQVKPNEYAQMMSLFAKKDVRQLVTDLKLLGQCAMQVIYSKDRKRIVNVHHIPVQLLRAEKCNEDGKIEAYYYSDNWDEVRKFPPKRISAFGTSKDFIEILFTKPYSVGLKYYALVDYVGGLPYCGLEEDISAYLINEVNNGFSGRTVVNFNNGIPSEDQQHQIKNKVLNQLTGTFGEKLIVAFNNNAESKTTVDAMPVNDAPDLYSTLSEECLRKIMLSHNVTSPLLFGIASSNGFSSNSDELKDSFALFTNMVIKPMQELLIDAFDEILAYNNISLNLYFKTLKPLEFIDIDVKVGEEELEEETGVELSEVNKDLQDFIDLGEEPNKEWLLLDEYEVDYDTDDKENELLSKEVKLSFKDKLVNLVSTGTAFPNAKDPKQDQIVDGVKFMTRYTYSGGKQDNTRPFCNAMVNKNKIYRKKDVLNMTKKAVNPGWGPRGANTYSIWLYKGGGNCHHFWKKQIYVSFEGTGIDVKSPLAKTVSIEKARKFGYSIKNNSVLVDRRPIDMPNQGFLPSNKRK